MHACGNLTFLLSYSSTLDTSGKLEFQVGTSLLANAFCPLTIKTSAGAEVETSALQRHSERLPYITYSQSSLLRLGFQLRNSGVRPYPDDRCEDSSHSRARGVVGNNPDSSLGGILVRNAELFS